MQSRKFVFSALVLAAVAGACDRKSPTDPNELQLARETGSSDTSGSGSNTPPPSPPPPTSNPPRDTSYAGPVRLTITVVGATRGETSGSDTLDVAPVANAEVEVQGMLQLGQSSGVRTDARGVVVFEGMIVGPYVVRVKPPAGSPFGDSETHVMLSRERVEHRVTLFERQ
jgi:hypothetical protein